jgi:hypothetical protein
VHILRRSLKRTILATLAIGLLAACAGVNAPASVKSETPQQSLSATGDAMAKLQSLRFTLTGTVAVTLPQQLADQLRAKAGSQGNVLSSSMTVSLKITGAAAKPDRLDAVIAAKTGGVTIDTEVIAAGGSLYVKDPMTGRWEALKRPQASVTGGVKPILSYQTLLDTAKSLTEVNGPTATLNGVTVDHYRVVPDLVKLFELISANHTAKNQEAASAILGVLQNANLTADLWTGTSDHLIHRLSYDVDVTADLHQLAPNLGSGASGNGATIPVGSMAHLTAHVVIDFADFNAPVKIQAPTLG